MSYTIIAKSDHNNSDSLTTINCSTSLNHDKNPQITPNDTFDNKSSTQSLELIDNKPLTTQNYEEYNIPCSLEKVKNKSYTVIKTDKSNENEEEREMTNKQLTDSKSQYKIGEKKSYTIHKGVALVDKNCLNKLKVDLSETETQAGGKVEEKKNNTKISNKSYTVIKRGDITDINTSQEANNGPGTVNDDEKLSEKELKCEHSPEVKNCFFIYLAHRLDGTPLTKNNKQHKNGIKYKELQNVQDSLRNYNVEQCTGLDEFLTRELEPISVNDSIIGVKTANKLLIENNYSNHQKELRPLNTNRNMIYKDEELKNNQSAIRNWQKLQYKKVKVQQYVHQNSPRTAVEKTTSIKRKPYILGNSSSEYHKTKCNISFPGVQFATIIPLLVQNYIMWYYEAKY